MSALPSAIIVIQEQLEGITGARREFARQCSRQLLSALAAEGLVVVPAEAISYARQMANLCFNYKQSSAFNEKVCRNMDEAQAGFDRAMTAAAQQEQKPAPGSQA